MSTGLNDNELISKVLNGDQQAYAGLVNRYQNYVFTLALRFTKNREDAEEVSQDIFVKAYRALGRFPGGFKIQHLAVYDCQYDLHYFFTEKKVGSAFAGQ